MSPMRWTLIVKIPFKKPTHTQPRVVFLANSMCAPNGVVSSVATLAREFQRRGIQAKIVSIGDVDEVFSRELGAKNIRPYSRMTSRMRDFETSKRVLKPVRRVLTIPVGILHATLARSVVTAISPDDLVIGAGMEALEYISQYGPVPGHTFVQVHTSAQGLQPDQWLRLERCAKLARCISVFTTQDRETLVSQGYENLFVIPNPNPLTRRTQLPEKRKEVAFIGRLAPEKQVDHAIRAFADAAPQGWSFQVYGNGALRPQLESLAAQLGANVHFHGAIKNVEEALSSAWIHLQTSKFEGFPMSVLEASALGTPTVAYACSSGVVEAVGADGVLVSPGNEQELVEVLTTLMSDERQLTELANQAIRDDRFAVNIIVDQWISIWSTMREQAEGV